MGNRWTPYPHDLTFGSHFIYPSGPPDPATRNLKSFLLNVKRDSYAGRPPRRLLPLAVARVAAAAADPGCAYHDFFGPHVMLVPAPGHGKMLKHSLSTARALCIELEALGLGKMVACIERTHAVAKSAWAPSSDRPTPQQHYDTMQIALGFQGFSEILVVDDIVTRGATLVAAAARLSEAYPQAKVRGFALARTQRFEGRNEEPVVGAISVVFGQAHRKP